MPGQLVIRDFAEADLAFADGVREAAGWNQTPEDWKRLISYAPQGCFLAEWDGQRAGTVTTTQYGDRLAWIGMMLVHPDHRRHGIATALMERALAHLRACGVGCIKLDATPEGEPVYGQLGFQTEFESHRWEGGPSGRHRGESERESLPLPLDFDTAAFGVDRGEWLEKISRDARRLCLAREGEGNPAAFGMIRPGARADYLGPATASDPASGREVMEKLLGSLGGTTFWDIPELNRDAVALAGAHGFQRTRPFVRMHTGDAPVPGNPALQFALGDPATG